MSDAPPNALPVGKAQPPALLRKKAKASPLVARKRPVARPAARPHAATNGAAPSIGGPRQPANGSEPPEVVRRRQIAAWSAQREANGGWWEPPPTGEVQEFPVFLTKSQVKEGIRHHIMKLSKPTSGGPLDLTNQNDFPRPVTLHRKDARSLNAARGRKEDSATPTPAPVDEAEAERLAKIEEEREAQRASDMAQIAPVGKDMKAAQQGKKAPPKPKIRESYAKKSAEGDKQNDIRYEESLPWVLEDADGKNAYVATYVAPLSEKSAALYFTNGKAYMTPLEKHFSFQHRPPFKTNTLEEAEKEMGKKMVAGRWERRDTEKVKVEEDMRATRNHFGGARKVTTESATYRNAARSEKFDQDDLDYNGEDEFQDDDEAPAMEADVDDEAKEAKDRIRRNQADANLFGDADEQEIIKLEKELEEEEEKRRIFGKKLTKALVKREKHLEYRSDSDSESGLFSDSSSSSADSDVEKKEESTDEAKLLGSSAVEDASKGTNSPISKPSPSDALHKGKNKRPGSPGLSETSETEASRKKKAKVDALQPSARSSTPLSAVQQRLKPTAGGGAQSDGEATGGEMSDATRAKRKKAKNKALLAGGAGGSSFGKGTPLGSRAGSPMPGASGQVSPRPGSPSPTARIEAAEIIAAIAAHPSGITVGQLLKIFNHRVDGPGQMSRKDWLAIVRANALISEKDGGGRLLLPKP